MDGIKFSSTKIDLKNYNHKGHFYNVVLPVKNHDSEKGKDLAKMFKITEVLPMQLRQFISQNNKFFGQESMPVDVNKHVEELELIKGNPEPYCNTSFAMLEYSLNKLTPEILT